MEQTESQTAVTENVMPLQEEWKSVSARRGKSRNVLMCKSSASNGSSELDFAKFIFPGFKLIKTKVQRRSRNILIDWAFLNTCTGCLGMIIIFTSTLIIAIVLSVTPDCPQSFIQIEGHCIVGEALAVWAFLTYVLQIFIGFAYVFHHVEKFKQSAWLLFEYYYYMVHFLVWLFLSTFTMAHNGLFIAAGSIGVLNSLIFLIMACNRNQLYALDKPAQDYFDDPDQDRRREEKMRTKYTRDLSVDNTREEEKDRK
ncbi:uncharacterized protein LOC141857165 [Brevipalpus obovatus]|uniref:uncharacterized protein LOC141857165 n=1 Tax=Brevipalpus obovatus TaxID=246614 RepID=UPI003D9F2D7F